MKSTHLYKLIHVDQHFLDTSLLPILPLSTKCEVGNCLMVFSYLRGLQLYIFKSSKRTHPRMHRCYYDTSDELSLQLLFNYLHITFVHMVSTSTPETIILKSNLDTQYNCFKF